MCYDRDFMRKDGRGRTYDIISYQEDGHVKVNALSCPVRIIIAKPKNNQDQFVLAVAYLFVFPYDWIRDIRYSLVRWALGRTNHPPRADAGRMAGAPVTRKRLVTSAIAWCVAFLAPLWNVRKLFWNILRWTLRLYWIIFAEIIQIKLVNMTTLLKWNCDQRTCMGKPRILNRIVRDSKVIAKLQFYQQILKV